MDRLFNGIYEGKEVIVTGHTGFKGSWLSIWLNELGAKVTGYALDPKTKLDNFVLSGLSGKITDIRGDIRDYDRFLKVLQEVKPDFLFHLAAQPLVRLSYEFPKDTYDINIGGTVNVLEAMRYVDSVRVAIMVTSDKCYENNESLYEYKEGDPMGGYDPYSSSKAAAEIAISGYRNSFFNPDKYYQHGKSVSSVRAGNVIGGGDWAKDRIVPDSIRALQKDKPIEVRNPLAIRPWQHVIEPVLGYLLLAAKMYEEPAEFAGSWNFGPDKSSLIRVKDLVKEIINNWGSGEWSENDNSSGLHEAKVLRLDINKAKSKLGWHPILGVKQAVNMTVNWYKNVDSGRYDMYDYCVDQITDYLLRLENSTQTKSYNGAVGEVSEKPCCLKGQELKGDLQK